MPTYLYKRQDGTTFEIQQRISDPKLTECPTTGQPVERLISGGAGLVFKGSGFYLTDYARKNASSAGGSSSDASSGSSPSAEATPAATASDKPATKTEKGSSSSSSASKD